VNSKAEYNKEDECFSPECDGCKISQGKPINGVTKQVIRLGDHWILNHYGGSEGFLGWIALQPRCHRCDLAELTKDEAEALGENIKFIDKALRQYWDEHQEFKNDRIKRIYVVYFFESVYDKPDPTKYHLHIHLIPRPSSFDKLLREYVGECKSTINAWKIYALTKYRDFPEKYRIDGKKDKQKVVDLMNGLQKELLNKDDES
jgi:diadenosine tetraphosphate (Ap4A) HIT family hydrolase